MESTTNEKVLVSNNNEEPVQPSRELTDYKWFYIIGGTTWSALILTLLIEWLVK